MPWLCGKVPCLYGLLMLLHPNVAAACMLMRSLWHTTVEAACFLMLRLLLHANVAAVLLGSHGLHPIHLPSTTCRRWLSTDLANI